MAVKIFKLSDVPLDEGYEAVVADVYTFTPNHIEVYIAANTENEPIDWNNEAYDFNTVDGSITKLSPIRKRFDLEAFEYKYDDFDIECDNEDLFWSDEVFNESILRAEIKLVYYFAKTNSYKGIFWGLIPLEDQTSGSTFFSYKTGSTSIYDSDYLKEREYSFKIINQLNDFKDVSIDELRSALEGEDSINAYSVYRGIDSNYILGVVSQWSFITVQSIIQNIFNLIMPTGFTLSITSPFEFLQTVDGTKWYLDSSKLWNENVLIPFCIITGSERSYSGMVFDNNQNLEHSFYKYKNCLELLKVLLTNFGLIWNIKYTIGADPEGQTGYKVNFIPVVSLLSRSGFTNIVTINEIIKIKESVQTENIKGCKIITANIGEVSAGSSEDDMKSYTGLFCTQMNFEYGNNNAASIKYIAASSESWKNSLYGVDTGFKIYFISVINDTYRNQYTISGNLNIADSNKIENKQAFALALANYYGGTGGIYSTKRKCLTVEADTLCGVYGGVEDYDLLEPLNRVQISYDNNGTTVNEIFTITQVEKDTKDNNSIIELRKF